MRKPIITAFAMSFIFLACSNSPKNNSAQTAGITNKEENSEVIKSVRHFRGALTGGMKGDSIFFDVSADGSKLENLTFKGYWRCDGKLEMQSAAGPQGYFKLVGGKVSDHISEPPNGGSTAWRFDLDAEVNDNKAKGKFRMNINALGCNTGTLSWEAVAR